MLTELNTLQDIPRIGHKLSKRFVEHFGSERRAMDVILSGDVASISEVEGIGHRYAVSLIQDVASRTQGVNVDDFLRTREAVNVYEKVLDLVKVFTNTRYSRDKMHVFFPYPSTNIDKIMEVRESISFYTDTVKTLEENGLIVELLSKVAPLNFKHKFPKIRERVIITPDLDSYEYAKSRFHGQIDIQLASSPSDIIDISRGFSQVIAVGDDYLSFDLPDELEHEMEFVSEIQEIDDYFFIPEKEIFEFSKNIIALRSSIEIISLLNSKDIKIYDQMDDGELELVSSTLSLIDEDGGIVRGADTELDRLSGARERLDKSVADTVRFINESMNKCLKNSQMTLSGQDMLKVMDGSLELKEMLGKELYKSYYSFLRQGIDNIYEDLCLEKKERIMVDSFFPEHIMHPVEADPDSIEAFKQYLDKGIRKRELQHKREVSRVLSSYREKVSEMVRKVLDFDVGFAIGSFSLAYDLSMPDIIDTKGIGFSGGRNLFLLSTHGDVIPVDYSVGENRFSPQDNSGRIVLLSGVNSGGKTSLLDLIAQCTILTHMGFPVPAKNMEISLTESMYYFAKSKGTMNAGAFETTLTQFSVLADDSSKIVLADELESITEPGASAKIMAGILEVLTDNINTMSIFVSHLSEQIMENISCDIRVDGIEASGLDKDLDLIVDRNPLYNYIAKSTPELIVERLSRKTEGKEKEFYKRLKEKFEV